MLNMVALVDPVNPVLPRPRVSTPALIRCNMFIPPQASRCSVSIPLAICSLQAWQTRSVVVLGVAFIAAESAKEVLLLLPRRWRMAVRDPVQKRTEVTGCPVEKCMEANHPEFQG